MDEKEKLKMDLDSSYLLEVKYSVDNNKRDVLEKDILEDSSNTVHEVKSSEGVEEVVNAISRLNSDDILVIHNYNELSEDDQVDLAQKLKGLAEHSQSPNIVVYYSDKSVSFRNSDLTGRVYSV